MNIQKIFLVFISILFINNIFAQDGSNNFGYLSLDDPTNFSANHPKTAKYRSDEYRYWGVKAGLTHNFLSQQPKSSQYLFLEKAGHQISLMPTESYFGYAMGGHFSAFLNNDFRRKGGIIAGIELNHYGISNKYITENTLAGKENTLIQNYYVVQAGPFAEYKFYNDYNLQRYFFAGLKADFNLMLLKSETASFDNTVLRYKYSSEEAKKRMRRQNFAAMLGFNYMFFNFELDYNFGSFLNTKYETTLYDGTTQEKPFEDFSNRGEIVLLTTLNVPLNSWTTRKVYEIETWFKRFF